MTDLPAGPVTLLFTDIEGSTQLLRRLGERYARVLANHHRLLRRAFSAHNGHEVDTQGDSFFVAFARPLDAVLAAAEAQQALFSQDWTEGGPVRVRMGLHTGEPLLTEDRDHYLGLDVHQAARIEAAAHGGQVLLSRATAELVGGRLPEGLELRPLGEHRLKDFDHPQALFHLLIDGLPGSFPPLRTAPSEPEPASGQGTGTPALVGRSEELALLQERLPAARSGRGSLVLLAGEPGIGKTRLAEELASEARQQGITVLWGRCWDGEGAPPFWPWLQLLQTYCRQQAPLTLRAELGSGAAAIAQLLPDLRERLPDLPGEAAGGRVGETSGSDPEAARFRLFQAVSRLFLNATQARPLLLLLDDLHWADKASLLLLQFLTQEMGEARLLVVGTYRDTDLDRRHPLAEALPSLRRAPRFERLLLRGLSRDEVERLLTVRAGHELDAEGQRLAAALHLETEGNPFFIGEVLRHLAENGKLRQQNGRWIVAARSIAELGIPEGVREVIGRRLSRLSEETNRLLGVAAVIGREFDAEVLELVAGVSGEAVDAALEEAERAQVLAAAGKGGARAGFSHALVRDVLLAELPTRRRGRLHRQVGEALERTYGTQAERHAAELATHFLEGNERERALRYSRLAGGQAEASTAWEEAVRHYEQCLTLLAEMGTDSVPAADSRQPDSLQRDEAALLLALGRCQSNAGETRPAWRSLMRAIDVYRSRDERVGAAWATLEATEIYAPQERMARLVETALAGLGDDEREPELAGRLLACLLNPMQTGSRESGEYARLRQRAQGLVDRHQLPLVAALVTYADAMQLFLFGNGERVLELLRRARGEFDKQGQSNLAMDAQRQVMENLIIIGRLGEAQGALEEMLATARRLHLHGREDESCGGLAGLRLAHAGYADFDTLEAERQYAGGNWNWSMLSPVRWLHVGELERAVAALPDLSAAGNVPNLLVRIGGVRARVLWLAGEQDAARQEWTRLLAMVPGDLHASVIDGVTVSGWAIVASGEALPHLADSAFLAAAAVFLQRREAAGLRWNCQRGTFESYQRQSAMVHLWCGHLEEAQSGLLEALDWCERERCPVEAGRCLQGLAEVAERRGQRQEALGYLERAAALFEQYGAKLYLEQVRATRAGLE